MRILLLLLLLPLLAGCGAPAPTTAPPAAPTSTAPSSSPTVSPTIAPTLAPTRAAPSATVSASTPAPTAASATPKGWTQLTAANSGPAPRFDHSVLFDPKREQLVIFGGRGSGVFGDTWLFDVRTRAWREVKGTAPSARFGHAAVYDAANRRMLLVMGQQGAEFVNDVWSFDLDKETWTQLSPSGASDSKPRLRYGQSAILDSRGRIVISHGFSDAGRFDDTWAFEPSAARWVNITPTSGPKPLKRCLHDLIYDAANDRMLLFGGCSSGFGPCPQGDLWAFDFKSNTWSELQPQGAKPTPRSNPAAIYDAARRQLLLFGGLTDKGTSDELWSYDLAANRWTKVESKGPSARSSHEADYDAQSGRMFVVGGTDSGKHNAEVWVLGL